MAGIVKIRRPDGMLNTSACVQASKALGWDGPEQLIPTMDAIDEAIERLDYYLLLGWNRFCHGPGAKRVGEADFKETLCQEALIITRIVEGLEKVREIIEGGDG
jgi:hypothetical protein